MNDGAVYLVLALVGVAMLIAWAVKHRDATEDDFIRLMMSMDLHRMVTLRALIMSIPAFMILGLALCSAPR